MRYFTRFLPAALVLIFAVVGWQEWRVDRADRQHLADTIKSQQHIIAEAETRERERATQLEHALAGIAAAKRTVVTPQQIVRELPAYLPLPKPLELVQKPGQAPEVKLPNEDLKSLFDFAADCRACKLELETARANLADEQQKSTALTRERDEAVHAARGGSFTTRVRRAGKWIVVGIITGVILTKVAGR